MVDTANRILPNNLIANVTITAPLAKSSIFLKQITYGEFSVSVIFAYHTNLGEEKVLGSFSGQITRDFQTMDLLPFIPQFFGKIVFGFRDHFGQSPNSCSFDYGQAILEYRAVVIHEIPLVTSIKDETGNSLAGFVAFGLLKNLVKTSIQSYPVGTISLELLNNSGFDSLADRSSLFGNCPTPAILQINNSVPYPPDITHENDNNIYVMGINPIVFHNSEDTAMIKVATLGVDLTSFCTQRAVLLPPVVSEYLIDIPSISFDSKSKYFSKSQTPSFDFVFSQNPEFVFWPNFVKSFTKSLSITVNGDYDFANTVQTSGMLGANKKAHIMMVKIKCSGNNSFHTALKKNNVAITSNFIGTVDGKEYVYDDITTFSSLLSAKDDAKILSDDVLTLSCSDVVDPSNLEYTVVYKEIFE